MLPLAETLKAGRRHLDVHSTDQRPRLLNLILPVYDEVFLESAPRTKTEYQLLSVRTPALCGHRCHDKVKRSVSGPNYGEVWLGDYCMHFRRLV